MCMSYLTLDSGNLVRTSAACDCSSSGILPVEVYTLVALMGIKRQRTQKKRLGLWPRNLGDDTAREPAVDNKQKCAEGDKDHSRTHDGVREVFENSK